MHSSLIMLIKFGLHISNLPLSYSAWLTGLILSHLTLRVDSACLFQRCLFVVIISYHCLHYYVISAPLHPVVWLLKQSSLSRVKPPGEMEDQQSLCFSHISKETTDALAVGEILSRYLIVRLLEKMRRTYQLTEEHVARVSPLSEGCESVDL